ncbi:Uncharacterised protein [Lachnospira pectinoschiza]|nr:Uncharacterised protein [Lachnospira pectinoschiza]
MDKEVKKHMVGGYEFNTKEDAQLAKDELNAIKYVSAKTNTKDPKQVYNLYNKIIERKLFSTQIGMNYLKQLQTFLYKSSEIPNDKIQPIPINADTQEALDKRKEQIEFKSELRNLSIQVAKYRNNFIRAMVLNIILVIVIIAMFVILKTSSNPNILNYEVTIQNRYAQWQQELQSEEESLKTREQELNNKKR